jgi:hypothetical protein
VLVKHALFSSQASSHFVLDILEVGEGGGRSHKLFAWPETSILQISASHIARITGMSHWRPGFVLCF